MANLVIVESPSKAATIKGYLGSNYKVVASKGHVRDLPKSTMGVDIDNNFAPHYINIRGKGDLIKEIKKEAKAAGKVFLATDPDREGEAISWHLAMTLGIPVEKTLRVTFNEITKTAVKSSIKAPRQIDMNLVNAQQARRILDRIVGYKLSPYLWKTVKSGLSAGRVQSVATRIIVDREEEIRAFVPEEYWTIDAHLDCSGSNLIAHFYGDESGRIRIANHAEAEKIKSAVDGKPFTVSSVKRGVRHKTPAPPFTTSTMQQEASRKLGFQSARTMRVAQELYEGINLGVENGGVQGLITYMRTDSLRISSEAQQAAKQYIVAKYGEKYYPASSRNYKTRAGAQDAHEAIRPSVMALEPLAIRKHLTIDQYRLYKLIWERFVASQMQSAELNTVVADFNSQGYIFRASGYTVAFPGYMAVYEETEDEHRSTADDDNYDVKDMLIPDIKQGQLLDCTAIDADQHFTEAPPRYTEASLIKFLEEKGIGRPSTYTPIITTIIGRNYVSRDGKSLVPTQLGEVTTKLMKENFADVVNYRFTAEMETNLDEIERGKVDMNKVLSDFWSDFSKELEAADKSTVDGGLLPPPEETDMICEKCGSRMVVKMGRYGKFAACPNYPQCRNTKPLESVSDKGEDQKAQKPLEIADFKCERCGGDMVLRTGKFGSFYACVNYPKCRFTKQKVKETDVPCPKCGAKIVIKHGRNKTVFYSCERYPECDFSSWDAPTLEKCPKCGGMLFRRKGKDTLYCRTEGCGYESEK
ncbi:MAG: type I DNA topoisomerase [Eubacteriales bacterium]|nr:type I DNA topoisomerase [Oscillospiraceae bacterium]MDD7675011.1 type I DNA topoisomerase [Eubacteriales bacterium]